MDRLLGHFSDWDKLKTAVAWIKLAMSGIKVLVQRRKALIDDQSLSSDTKVRDVDAEMLKLKLSSKARYRERLGNILLTNEMLQDAEKSIILYEQRRGFQEELHALHRNQQLIEWVVQTEPNYPRRHAVCMRETEENRGIPQEAKYPLIIPKSTVVSKPIYSEDPQSYRAPIGRITVIAELRQKYWIIGDNPLIKQILFKCVLCRKYQARKMHQKMADLPSDRLTPDEPPFSRVGMDYFGPFNVKRGRVTVKRYGVIYTCLSSRAVHLEIAYSIETDSCIHAIRRFIARRGVVKSIISDNGTNLVGANRELKEEILKWNKAQFNDMLAQRGISWEFNPGWFKLRRSLGAFDSISEIGSLLPTPRGNS